MNTTKKIKIHIALFTTALLASVTGFAYDIQQPGQTQNQQAEFIAYMDYLPTELLGWL